MDPFSLLRHLTFKILTYPFDINHSREKRKLLISNIHRGHCPVQWYTFKLSNTSVWIQVLKAHIFSLEKINEGQRRIQGIPPRTPFS